MSPSKQYLYTIVPDIRVVSSNLRLQKSWTGRLYNATAYDSCLKILTQQFMSQTLPRTPIEACTVTIKISRQNYKGDIDNCAKVILDALQKAEVIKDDRHVHRLIIERHMKDSVVIVEAGYR